MKISFYCNLATVYKKTNRRDQALNLIKNFFNDKKFVEEEKNINYFCSEIDPNLLGIENLFVIYGQLLYSAFNHEEALLYIEKSYEMLKKILENYETLHRNSVTLNSSKNKLGVFLKYLTKKKKYYRILLLFKRKDI